VDGHIRVPLAYTAHHFGELTHAPRGAHFRNPTQWIISYPLFYRPFSQQARPYSKLLGLGK